MNEYEYQSSDGGEAFVLFFLLIGLAVSVLILVAMWKVFAKAGKPGWAAIVPFYNWFVMCEIVGRPWWWFLLILIPYAGIVFQILILIDLARSFGQGGWYAVALIFAIGWPMLAWGDAQYQGPVHSPV